MFPVLSNKIGHIRFRVQALAMLLHLFYKGDVDRNYLFNSLQFLYDFYMI